MIKSTELRNGNYVTTPDSSSPFILSPLMYNDIYLKEKGIKNDYLDNLPELNAVPISISVLKCCYFLDIPGLWKTEYVLQIDGNASIIFTFTTISDFHCRLFIRNENDDLNINLAYLDAYRELPIKHLHELQNFYRFFTGNEMPINIKQPC